MRGGRLAGVGAALAATFLACLAWAPASHAAQTPLVVWASPTSAAVLQEQFADGYQGRPVQVVVKAPESLVSDLGATPVEATPDVIEMPHRLVGTLAVAQSIVPISVSPKVAARFAPQVWRGFTPSDLTYGMPVMVSNAALLTNATLVPTQPTGFSALADGALALVNAGKAKVPLAIGQSPTGDGTLTYPLFSALGGYFLGSTDTGAVDVTNVGLANSTFIANTPIITEWNTSRLLRSSITPERARDLFVKGRTPYWIAPVSELDAIMKLTFSYRITAVPPVVAGRDAAPLLDMTGFAMTRWAEQHGVAEDAASFVATGLSRKGIQSALATAGRRVPALVSAQQAMATTGEAARLRAFLQAGTKGVAAPSVPQQAELIALGGGAWLESTAGTAATKPKPTFKKAQAQAELLMGIQ